MNIADIATPDFVEVDADKRLGKVRSIFERENSRGVIVTNDGEYAGVIGEKQLVRSRMEDDTKASAVMKSAPKIDRHEDVREAARMLVEGDTRIAPAYEGEKLYGIITGNDILEAVLDNLDAISVEDILTKDVVTIGEKSHVGQAINRLRENGISRLPVTDEDGKLTGVLTTHDIIEFSVRNADRQGRGDRRGDLDRMLDLPVYDLMSSPVITATPGEKIDTVVSRMFDNDIEGVVVTPTDSDTEVLGILTKTDVLRALTFTEEERMDVQITNIGLLETLTRDSVVDSITKVVDKYQQMQVHHAHVRFHEHKEKLRGTPLIQSQVRLRTSHGQVAGSGEGYGAEHAFHVALDKLERNVLELKGVNADEKYQGQVMRKLGDL
ncbi:transcriptional regulator [Halogeometricum borinquense DSM 11551]|uniref:Transcriptional regulator n=2 Tax=Halogeometricum borinquense TaxID=60847 RepID=E4NNY3_HALBP|nr:CBS domain-containing protein [Halogeometricum borinquense]ADQ66414.1 predicted transcriptional regulator, contains C-terminal CBS domains [Halogeometricum borinquense DSM 11551]ELY31134.1 transcriptional regulator [Halogeometricum borinquense DSM 11551]RYJ15185.1 CBS domain-containing protein [Halogeometricum borinquense]